MKICRVGGICPSPGSAPGFGYISFISPSNFGVLLLNKSCYCDMSLWYVFTTGARKQSYSAFISATTPLTWLVGALLCCSWAVRVQPTSRTSESAHPLQRFESYIALSLTGGIYASKVRVYGRNCIPELLDTGGHNIFCPPQYFVIKNNVVEKILWLHYCWRPPLLKPGNKQNRHYHWSTYGHSVQISYVNWISVIHVHKPYFNILLIF